MTDFGLAKRFEDDSEVTLTGQVLGSPNHIPPRQALAEDVGRFLNGEPVLARPVGASGKVLRWCRRQPLRASLVAGSAVVLVGGIGGVFWQWRQAQAIAAANCTSTRWPMRPAKRPGSARIPPTLL